MRSAHSSTGPGNLASSARLRSCMFRFPVGFCAFVSRIAEECATRGGATGGSRNTGALGTAAGAASVAALATTAIGGETLAGGDTATVSVSGSTRSNQAAEAQAKTAAASLQRRWKKSGCGAPEAPPWAASATGRASRVVIAKASTAGVLGTIKGPRRGATRGLREADGDAWHPSSASRHAATLCGRSCGLTAKAQSMALRKSVDTPGMWRVPSASISS